MQPTRTLCVEWRGELVSLSEGLFGGFSAQFKHLPTTFVADVVMSAPNSAEDELLTWSIVKNGPAAAIRTLVEQAPAPDARLIPLSGPRRLEDEPDGGALRGRGDGRARRRGEVPLSRPARSRPCPSPGRSRGRHGIGPPAGPPSSRR